MSKIFNEVEEKRSSLLMSIWNGQNASDCGYAIQVDVQGLEKLNLSSARYKYEKSRLDHSPIFMTIVDFKDVSKKIMIDGYVTVTKKVAETALQAINYLKVIYNIIIKDIHFQEIDEDYCVRSAWKL